MTRHPALLHLALLLTTTACSSGPSQEEIDHCTANGVAYFKEIDSYPTLKSPPNIGRRAEEVARERCERTLTAFPDMDTPAAQ